MSMISSQEKQDPSPSKSCWSWRCCATTQYSTETRVTRWAFPVLGQQGNVSHPRGTAAPLLGSHGRLSGSRTQSPKDGKPHPSYLNEIPSTDFPAGDFLDFGMSLAARPGNACFEPLELPKGTTEKCTWMNASICKDGQGKPTTAPRPEESKRAMAFLDVGGADSD